jgi:undecaprenyl-diphosphatase
MELYAQKKTPVIRWIILTLLLLIFAADLAAVILGYTADIDKMAMDYIVSIRDPFLTTVAKGITFMGDTKTIIGLALIFLIIPGRLKFGLPLTIAAGISGGIQTGLKYLIQRPRPDEAIWLIPEDGFSFPSGHSCTGLMFYIFMMILLRRLLIIRGHKGPAYLITCLFPILVIGIGLSRLYLGVHYPSDVLGGWVLASALLIIVVTLYDTYYPIKKRISYVSSSDWDLPKKHKPWRTPHYEPKEGEMIEFPKYRSKWRTPKKPE